MLHTTGRLATRLNEAQRQAIIEALGAFALPAKLPAQVELEVGIGNGLALIERAKANPKCFFVGTDIYLNGLEVAAKAAKGVPNVALLNEDARLLLARLPSESITRFLSLHPDPWPKKSHHKRRLIQPSLLTDVARVLKKGGEFWVVTDWPDYAFHALSVLYQSPQFQLHQTGEEARDCKVRSPHLKENGFDLGPHHLATPPSWWVPTIPFPLGLRTPWRRASTALS
jgi:tRNA (guanine-N(7)-)-methyltransferase